MQSATMDKEDVSQRMARPLILNQPFVPRSTTFPDDDDEYESAYSPPGTPIMTPRTEFADDDLPPTYEEAQRAHALEQVPAATSTLELHRLSITDEAAARTPVEPTTPTTPAYPGFSPQHPAFEKIGPNAAGPNPPYNPTPEWNGYHYPRGRSWQQWQQETERWWSEMGGNIEKQSNQLGRFCEEWAEMFGKKAEAWSEHVARRASGGPMGGDMPQHSFPRNGGYYYPNYFRHNANNYDGIVSRGCRSGPFWAGLIEQQRDALRLYQEDANRGVRGFHPHHRGRGHHHWQGRTRADHRDIVETPVAADSDGEISDDELPDPQIAFLEKLRDINARAESLESEGKKPQWQINHDRDKAIEKAQKEKEKAILKLQHKLANRERKRELRQAKKNINTTCRERKREIHQAKKLAKQEWKQEWKQGRGQACHPR